MNKVIRSGIIGNLRIVQIAVSSLLGVSAALKEQVDNNCVVPVVEITHSDEALSAHLGRIFVYSALIDEGVRGYSTVIEFIDRPNVVIECVGLQATLTIIRDAIHGRVTDSIDRMTRGRFELDFERVYTIDDSEFDLTLRRLLCPRDAETGLLIQHVTLLGLWGEVCFIEQLGSQWEAATELWKLTVPCLGASAMFSTHDEVASAFASLRACLA